MSAGSFISPAAKPVPVLAVVSEEHQIAAVGTKLYAGALSLV